MRPSRAPLTFLLVSSLCSTVGLADDVSSGGDLDAVVVSATRTEQPRALTGESISLITAPEIALHQTVVLSDALQETPGLVVIRNGGYGQPAGIGLRGTLAGQTLVLIDGVRVNDPSAPDGAAIISDLLANNLERIEVLRGPQSTL